MKLGSQFVGGVEFNETPLPKRLVKVMKREWAENLRDSGEIKLGSFTYYRKWEAEFLGDKHDGIGLFHLDDHPMQVDSANEVFIWCSSLPCISFEQKILLAKSGNYDCLVTIRDPYKFIMRIRDKLRSDHPSYPPHCGQVKYNRGHSVDKQTLNAQNFHFNVFQKAEKFADNIEYRIAITNCSNEQREEDHFKIALGNCSDIISISDFPGNGWFCGEFIRWFSRFWQSLRHLP